MNTLDASKLLPRFVAPVSLTVHRKATGSFVKGQYVPAGSETTFAVTNASVQPLSGRELQLLPEGYRTRQTLKVYSDVELRSADAEAGREADRFDYLGEQFEVYSVQDWVDHGNYFKVLAVQLHKT